MAISVKASCQSCHIILVIFSSELGVLHVRKNSCMPKPSRGTDECSGRVDHRRLSLPGRRHRWRRQGPKCRTSRITSMGACHRCSGRSRVIHSRFSPKYLYSKHSHRKQFAGWHKHQAVPLGTAHNAYSSAIDAGACCIWRCSIDHPGFGAKVGACAVFSGKADLLPGETLVLSALNLSDPAKVLYLQAVNDWDLPADVTHWTGYQYFGSGDSSLGQAFEVSVIVMKIRTVTAILAEPANRPIWHVKSLPNDSEVKQTLRVIRMKGSGPAVCH
jgi:hypothetical protein